MNYQTRKWRDGIRREYLNDTGRKKYDHDNFLIWLSKKPEHEAHAIVFSDDEQVAKVRALESANKIASVS